MADLASRLREYAGHYAAWPKGLPDTLLAAAAELDKRRWVPVEERLPEQSGEYLVVLYTVPDVTRLYYYYAPNEEFGQIRSGVWCAETVTHWMPLPEPPEEVTP